MLTEPQHTSPSSLTTAIPCDFVEYRVRATVNKVSSVCTRCIWYTNTLQPWINMCTIFQIHWSLFTQASITNIGEVAGGLPVGENVHT